MMKAVILAAGKGTRMKEITKTMPKPMVLINGKPMLEHIITSIKNSGVKEFGLVVGYMKEAVTDYFGDGTAFGVSINYIEQKEQNGTGAALHLAKNYTAGDTFFFTFGDVLTPPENYSGMIDFYFKHKCDALLGLNTVDDPFKGAAVYIDNENNIVKMVEKPPIGTSTTNLNNSGIMILYPEIFDYTAKLKLSPRGEYELTDVFNMLKNDRKSLKGYVLSGYWKDVGTPEDLETINKQIK
jgi:UDP-N-acetylglucosamine diphosphorylase / glucose-1-phosphate thymidylyltransferase / UDP-N-acetylgalactosamine diphosphorylase / glucosamine-1-phosphate N-acetyltransferase / galactosamine-1-phosphate N-acetyltransferase